MAAFDAQPARRQRRVRTVRRPIGRTTRIVAKAVLGGLVLVFAFTALYVSAFHAPRPKGFDIGVVGAPQQAAQIQSALDKGSRGAFDVRRYETEPRARAALLDTHVHGVLVPGSQRDRVLLASAPSAGTSPASDWPRGCSRSP